MKESQSFLIQIYFLYKIIIRKWKIIFGVPFALSVIAAIFILMVPKKYESQGIIFIPSNSIDLTKMQDMASLVGFGGSLGGDQGEIDRENLAFTLLNTKDIIVPISEHFKLDSLYKIPKTAIDYNFKILKSFSNHLTVDITDEDAIILRYRDVDAQRAKLILDSLISKMNKKMISVEKESIKERNLFVSNQTLNAKKALNTSHQKMATFQKETHFIGDDQQIELAIEQRVKWESDLLMKKLQLNIEKTKRGKESVRYKNLLEEYTSMSTVKLSKKQGYFLNKVDQLPENIMKFAELKRELMVNEKVFEFLSVQAEQLKIESVKNLKNIVIIEAPWINWKRVSPPRTLTVLIVGFLSFLILVSYFSIRQLISDRLSIDKNFKSEIERIKNY